MLAPILPRPIIPISMTGSVIKKRSRGRASPVTGARALRHGGAFEFQ